MGDPEADIDTENQVEKGEEDSNDRKEEEESEEDWENWEEQFDSNQEDQDSDNESKEEVESPEQQYLKRQEAAKVAAQKAEQEQEANDEDPEEDAQPKQKGQRELRSPIICVMGHVDTGKTKLLDKLRKSNVQDNEAGGITQQIGATYFPLEKLQSNLDLINKGATSKLEYRIPGLLVIDTPGHESFSNLRKRGSNLCDIAILVIDLMHGLEPQTKESITLLRESRTPFIVALNKVDRLYGWNTLNRDNSANQGKGPPDGRFRPIRRCLSRQDGSVVSEFYARVKQVTTELMEEGLNSSLYWENEDFKRNVSLVPTSAHTGEGLSDLLFLLIRLTQSLMGRKLILKDVSKGVECNVIEVKKIEGIGTTIDVILVNGELKEGEDILVATLNGPIRTQIKALLTPQPLKEMRVKGNYIHHKKIRAAAGIKIVGHGNDLESAIAGTQIFPITKKMKERDIRALERDIMKDFETILDSIDSTKAGVCVQASTLGSLEALIDFLRSVNIDINTVNIGPVHKKDVMKASSMLEQKAEFAVILAFDVKVTRNATELAQELGVRIFTAEIIYHLFDQFTKYMEEVKERKKEETRDQAVFPCILEIQKENVFMKKNPLVFGVEVKEGILRTGTPIVVPGKFVPNPDPQGAPEVLLELGKVTSIQRDQKPVDSAKAGSKAAIKIEGNQLQSYVQYGRHFDHTNSLVSKLTRESIDALKLNFKDELEKQDWMTVIKLKKVLNIL